MPEENNLCVWGDNSFGQLAFDNANNELKVFVPKMLSFGIHIVEISCGFEHSLLRSIKGELYSVGNNRKGQLGIGKKFKRKMAPTMVNLEDPAEKILLASAQGDHNVAYSEFGRLYAWGDNSSGQLGTGDLVSHDLPTDISSNVKLAAEESVITLSCGRDHSVMLLNTFRVLAWGSNQFYQLGIDSKTNDNVLLPTEAVAPKCKGIAAGYEHTLFLDVDGGVWVAGNNDNERLIPGKKTPRIKLPAKLEMEEPAKRVFASNFNCVITEKNNLFLWGCFMDQVLPLSNPFEDAETDPEGPQGGSQTKKSQNRSTLKFHIESAGLGENFLIAADEFGDCFGWGFNGSGELGQSLEADKAGQTLLTPKRLEILSPFEVKSIYTGRNFVYTIIVERAGEPELAEGNLVQYSLQERTQGTEGGFGRTEGARELESDVQSSGGSRRGRSVRDEESRAKQKAKGKAELDQEEFTPRDSVEEIKLNMDAHSLDVVRILVFLYESLRFHLIKIIDDSLDVDAALPPELIDLIKRQQDIIDDYIHRCGLKVELNLEVDSDNIMEFKYPEGLKLMEGLPHDLGTKSEWTSTKVESSQAVVAEQAKTKKLKTETLIKMTQMMSMLAERIPELKRVLKVK